MAETEYLKWAFLRVEQEMDTYTRIYLVRHGHLVNSAQQVLNGQSDIELSPKGMAMTETLAEWFIDKPIRVIYSSDLKRSLIGARIVASVLGVEVISTGTLREINFGRWEGLKVDEVRKKFNDIWARWIEDPVNTFSPGGESLGKMKERVLNTLYDIVRRHMGEEVIIFSHSGVNRLILCHALNMHIKDYFRIQQDFCSVNIIDFYNNTALVRLMNWSPAK